MAKARTQASTRRFGLALVQFGPKKGDVDANFQRIGEAFDALASDKKRSLPDVIVFPEATLSGYFVEGGVHEVALPAKTALERLHKIAKAKQFGWLE